MKKQTKKEQGQKIKIAINMEDINQTISVIIFKNHGLSTSMKWHNLQVDKKGPNIFSTKKIHLNFKDKDRLNLKGWRQIHHASTDQKAGVAYINFIQSRL